MPIIVKAKQGDSNNDVIKKYKKAASAADIVTKSRNRRFYIKPSQQRAVKKTERRRLSKRARSLKKMKNISPAAIKRINERLNTK